MAYIKNSTWVEAAAPGMSAARLNNLETQYDSAILTIMCGDGSDGDITISINTNLTRDMQYNSLTINGGITLYTKGYRILCKGSLTNNGIIDNNGGAGGTGKLLPGAGAPSGTLGGGGIGGLGGGGDGPTYGGGSGGGGAGVILISAFNIVNTSGIIRANGGLGGTGGSDSGGGDEVGSQPASPGTGFGKGGGAGGNSTGFNGGAGGLVTLSTLACTNPILALLLVNPDWATPCCGGSGGGGGGEDIPTGGCGGGGGGGGGHILLLYRTASWGSELVTGGAGGSPHAPGTAGTAGTTGTINKVTWP